MSIQSYSVTKDHNDVLANSDVMVNRDAMFANDKRFHSIREHSMFPPARE